MDYIMAMFAFLMNACLMNECIENSHFEDDTIKTILPVRSHVEQRKLDSINLAINFLEKQKNIKFRSRRLRQSDISDDIMLPRKNNNEIELKLKQQQDKAPKKRIAKDPKSYKQPIIKNPNQR